MVERPTTAQSEDSTRGLGHPGFGWLAVFVVALILYMTTASRGTQWQDSGLHILRIMDGELVHPLGLALSHPVHFRLGRAALSLGMFEPCFAITLVSALAGAIAVANVFGCVITLTQSRWAGGLAAAGLMLANTFWQVATRAEVYTVSAALFSGECWCLALYAVTQRRHYFWGAVFLNGLGVANHLQGALTTPVLAVIAIWEWRKRSLRVLDLPAAAALWLIGSLPYLGLVMLEMTRGGHPSAVIYSALFGRSFADEVLNVDLSARLLLSVSGFLLLGFPNLQWPAFVYGLAARGAVWRSTMLRRILWVELLIHVAFVMRYNVVDQHYFLLPTLVLVSLVAGVGFGELWKSGEGAPRQSIRAAAAALVLLTPLVYAIVPGSARRLEVLKGVERHKPYRDDYAYLFWPWSRFERSAERMSDHAVELARPNGLIIVEDRMGMFAVEYAVRRAGLREVKITQDVLPQEIKGCMENGRPVVLVPANVNEPRTAATVGRWERTGDLYRLRGLNE